LSFRVWYLFFGISWIRSLYPGVLNMIANTLSNLGH
jgi:hypothetical protein